MHLEAKEVMHVDSNLSWDSLMPRLSDQLP